MNKNEIKGLGPNSKKLKDYKESLGKLSKMQQEAAVGLMLGDASIQSQNGGKTYRMKFEWGDRNKAYLDHVYKLFNEWVLSDLCPAFAAGKGKGPHKKVRVSPKGNTVVNWGFQSISHKAFNDLANLFISPACSAVQSWSAAEPLTNKKSISANLIKKYLTPRGLAYWFMDDGGKLDYNKNSKNKGVVLNTQSFEAKEVKAMSKELSEKFNLECEVRSNKGKKVIVIKSTSYSTFLALIDPYIIPEMRYKLP